MGDLRNLSVDKKHVKLSELKNCTEVDNSYLWKTNIPPYPKSVLFRISRVCHVTGESGLHGIIEDGGFLATTDNFVWFSLSVTKNDIASAERRFLKRSYGAEACNQYPFLENFTTSPAFQSGSRYGNFRFTFPFRKLLRQYAKQFCNNSAPVLRVLRTDLYRQEILYAVLVHPPDVRDYDQYHRLPVHDKDGLCGYRWGRVFWFCQSPSNCYRYQLQKNEEEMWAEPLCSQEYYVWDHVAVAFHMELEWTLEIDKKWLLSNVTACKVTEPCLLRQPDIPLTKKKAEEILEKLKESYLC